MFSLAWLGLAITFEYAGITLSKHQRNEMISYSSRAEPCRKCVTHRVDLVRRRTERLFLVGSKPSDRYLHKQAAQDVKTHVAAVFSLTPDGKTIAGYYALSQYFVQLDRITKPLAKGLPKCPMAPAMLIGRLAFSRSFQGQGLGELVLTDALHRCLVWSRQVASAAVIVDAKNEAAAVFHRKYGFIDLPKAPARLFLPMAHVIQVFP